MLSVTNDQKMFWRKKKINDASKYDDSDFSEFIKDITWFVKPTDKVNLGKKEINPNVSNLFRETFPQLSKLICKSRVLSLSINEKQYKLFSWTNKNNECFGWLNEIQTTRNNQLNFILEHELFLEEIGGIRESYRQPEPSLSNNQNFLFIGAECSKGIGGWDDYYKTSCEQEGHEQIDYKDFICFVGEANGDVTLYNPSNSEVLLFAHDHCFENVDFMDGQPKYTFHTIQNVENICGLC